jgi:diguanylate cyclase (GGDEF)-like protein
MNIATMFAGSTRQVRQNMRTKVFFEWHARSVRHSILYALLGASLWGADWAMDPYHTKNALFFRLGVLAVLLFSAAVKWLSKSLHVNYFASYLALAASEVLFIALFDRLENGLVAGAGQFLYFFLGSLMYCTLYPSHLNALGCAALAAVPLLAGALIAADFPYFLYAFTLWPAAMLTMLAHWRIRPLLVENIRLRQQVEASTLNDPVTGLLNLHGLEQAFQRLIKLGQIKPLQQFLLLIEIDGLDALARAHGQEFIDALRAKMGQIVDISFRGRDITASPGNEFACILQNISREKAFDVAERFRESILGKEFDGLPGAVGPAKCTVSIGIVSADTKEQIATLLNQARLGVNQAKSLGGNQCVCF